MCISYECVLLFGVLFFFGYAFSALAQFKGESGQARWAFQVFVTMVLGIYFGWSWSQGRRTLPMKTMSVRLETTDGHPLTVARALTRFLAALGMLVASIAGGAAVHPLLYVAVLLPYAWVLVDRDRRALYDLVSGTRLVFCRRDDL